jgi:uncharacterized protein YndB with AHSA1/START domain
MALKEIDVRGTTTADPDAVWRLLGDSSTWPDWTPIDEYEPERPGGGDGLGEIRRFRTGRHRVREEIVERADGRRLTYALLSGLALRDYRAEIDLTPAATGTEIRWHTTFRPKVPGSGWLYRRALEGITRTFVDGLAAAATSSGQLASGGDTHVGVRASDS